MEVRERGAGDRFLGVDFDRAFEMLSRVFDLKRADEMFPVRGNAVYGTSVVLWMLVYQRMCPDSTLEAAVKKLLETMPGLLPANKRVTEGTLSDDTGAYSKARTRLPPQAAVWFAEEVSQSFIKASPPSYGDRRVFLIDGTTITLAPERALQRAYPPASNQHGEGIWPVVLLVVAHELASGAALVPEIGAMYGPAAVSETSLIRQSLRAMPPQSIVMADAGFGIFAVAHEVVVAGHSFLFRMTKQRFLSLQRRATRLNGGDNWTTSVLRWCPSPKDRKTHPDLPTDAALEVHLHEVIINPELTLYLVTDLTGDVECLADLYLRRVDVEIDIRNLKIVLDTETIRARSVDTFLKELHASIISYNLVVQFRRQAAEQAGLPPRRLSFKRVWTAFHTFLLPALHTDPAQWQRRYQKALHYAMNNKLPNRPGRSYEREAYPRRPKSNQFKKRLKPPEKHPAKI